MELVNPSTGECQGYVLTNALSKSPTKTLTTIFVNKEYWGMLESIDKATEQLAESYGRAFGPADKHDLSSALDEFECAIFTMAAYRRIGGGCPEIESTNSNDLSIMSAYVKRILRDRIEMPVLENVTNKGIGGIVCLRLALFMALAYEFVLEEVTVALHNQYLEHFYHMLMCKQGAED